MPQRESSLNRPEVEARFCKCEDRFCAYEERNPASAEKGAVGDDDPPVQLSIEASCSEGRRRTVAAVDIGRRPVAALATAVRHSAAALRADANTHVRSAERGAVGLSAFDRLAHDRRQIGVHTDDRPVHVDCYSEVNGPTRRPPSDYIIVKLELGAARILGLVHQQSRSHAVSRNWTPSK